jgi:ABC-2 type transport system ATP-binding protein
MSEAVSSIPSRDELRAEPAQSNGKAPSVSTALLQARGLTKRWQRGRLTVLDAVDLTVERGTLLSVFGANGSGKTTFLRIVAGLIQPDAGTLRLDGRDPNKHRAEYQRRIGFLSAGYGGMYARLTVAAQLDLWARLAFVPANRRTHACDEAMARFGLFELARRRLDRLSMGQRQRVRLAMAFLHEPQLLLLDEPWNSLDEEGERLLAASLIELRNRGGTAVCCTPTGTEIGRTVARSDQRLRLEGGRLHAE